MSIVCDTDFLSSFLKINRLELVKYLFEEENMYIPVAVLTEIAKTDLITDLLNIPAFLLACKDAGILNNEEIATIIQDLKEKDYYEFSEEEKQRLMNN